MKLKSHLQQRSLRILKRSSKDSDDPQVITLRDKVRKELQYYIDTPCLDVEEDPLL